MYCAFCEYWWAASETDDENICPDCLSDLQPPPDPPYDHTGYDTLEEKALAQVGE